MKLIYSKDESGEFYFNASQITFINVRAKYIGFSDGYLLVWRDEKEWERVLRILTSPGEKTHGA